MSDFSIEHNQLKDLSIIVNKTDNSIIVLNVDGLIEWVNPGFERMYGYTLDEFHKTFYGNVLELKGSSKLIEAIEKCKVKKESVVYQNYWITKSDKKKWIQTTLTPVLSDNNEIVRYIAIESDVTKFKSVSESLEAKNEHLIMLMQKLEKSNELLENQRLKIEKQKEFIEEQKKKSDKLLLNILPFEIAEQLKKKGFAKSKNYRRVSVLFADFKDFTKLSEILSTQELIKELNIYFEKFDAIIDDHYIEKIKTIGDAYMCAGGLPLRNKSNPIDIVLAGLQIQDFMQSYAKEKLENGEPVWDLRVGIHTGEVIAGVIGKKKFAYDIWGDTVNTASRLQDACEIKKVNVSGGTYEFVKDYFDCTFRGKIEVKNKGEIDMYYVNGLKAEYAEDENRVMPNEKFTKILNKF
ncbi:MAG: PAS domain-containing protein [Bacteroidales bacterium]|jgi:PAS domain S-box-containing protein|nr:PAS domain-containing protein [Bacteroidales bacterium]